MSTRRCLPRFLLSFSSSSCAYGTYYVCQTYSLFLIFSLVSRRKGFGDDDLQSAGATRFAPQTKQTLLLQKRWSLMQMQSCRLQRKQTLLRQMQMQAEMERQTLLRQMQMQAEMERQTLLRQMQMQAEMERWPQRRKWKRDEERVDYKLLISVCSLLTVKDVLNSYLLTSLVRVASILFTQIGRRFHRSMDSVQRFHRRPYTALIQHYGIASTCTLRSYHTRHESVDRPPRLHISHREA